MLFSCNMVRAMDGYGYKMDCLWSPPPYVYVPYHITITYSYTCSQIMGQLANRHLNSCHGNRQILLIGRSMNASVETLVVRHISSIRSTLHPNQPKQRTTTTSSHHPMKSKKSRRRQASTSLAQPKQWPCFHQWCCYS